MPADQGREDYTWRPQSKALTLRFDVKVIDRINVEVMRGFAVTRRRGTEAGGVLIGSVASEPEPVVTVQDFEAVPCEYSQGPSYILSARDKQGFQEVLDRWRSAGERGSRPIGFWRAHTREGLALDEQDALLFREFFHDPRDFALLIKPFATRPNTAKICLQDAAGLQLSGSPPEFLFARAGSFSDQPPVPAPVVEAPPPPPPPPPPPSPTPPLLTPPLPEPVPEAKPSPAPRRSSIHAPTRYLAPIPEDPVEEEAPATVASERADIRVVPPPPLPRVLLKAPVEEPEQPPLFSGYQPKTPSPWRRRLAWVAFTTAALGLGALAGFEFAGGQAVPFATGVQSTPQTPDPFDVQLTAKSEGDSIQISWNRSARAILQAERGLLSITESGAMKGVTLSAAELQSGSILYRHLTGSVLLRFEVFLRENRSLVEILNWSGPPPAAPDARNRR